MLVSVAIVAIVPTSQVEILNQYTVPGRLLSRPQRWWTSSCSIMHSNSIIICPCKGSIYIIFSLRYEQVESLLALLPVSTMSADVVVSNRATL